ncbi:MAG: symmetrical bis(5'-nucleosyl)-tetraphosphatase [Gammaproteobacteria bacterium]
MSTYVIGDVHGCFQTLVKLLTKINYKEGADNLFFIGDLVNRGKFSAEVLEFCITHDGIDSVLGNHDFLFLKLINENKKYKPLQKALEHPQKEIFYQWLIKRPLLAEKYIGEKRFILVHAGIPSFWTTNEAIQMATKASNFIQKDPLNSILAIWGNEPRIWSPNLTQEQQIRFSVNCFTRMRFIGKNGEMDLNNTSTEAKTGYKKWFDAFDFKKENITIVFGHWASLNGKTKTPSAIGLDTGCVWGNRLSALRLEDQKTFSVKVLHEDI